MEYCEYELHRNPSAAPTGSKYMHARLVIKNKVNLKGLVHDLAQRVRENEHVVGGVVEEFIKLLGDRIGNGEHVQVDGLGGFHLSLECPPGVKDPKDIRGNSITVRSIEYRPDKSLVDHLKTHTKFRRSPYKKNLNSDMNLVIEEVRAYFNDPTNRGNGITSRHLKDALHITRQCASDRLHELVERGFLISVSPDIHHPLYMPGPKFPSDIDR